MADDAREIGRIGFDNDTPVVSDPIFVKLSSYKGKKYLDIRKFYEKDGQWLPTTKGVTLHKDQIYDLMNIISANKDEIENWFR